MGGGNVGEEVDMVGCTRWNKYVDVYGYVCVEVEGKENEGMDEGEE